MDECNVGIKWKMPALLLARHDSPEAINPVDLQKCGAALKIVKVCKLLVDGALQQVPAGVHTFGFMWFMSFVYERRCWRTTVVVCCPTLRQFLLFHIYYSATEGMCLDLLSKKRWKFVKYAVPSIIQKNGGGAIKSKNIVWFTWHKMWHKKLPAALQESAQIGNVFYHSIDKNTPHKITHITSRRTALGFNTSRKFLRTRATIQKRHPFLHQCSLHRIQRPVFKRAGILR